MTETEHKEQPPSKLIVLFRKFPQGDGLEDRLDFDSLKIIKHNGDDPIDPPRGMISLELVQLLEANHRGVCYDSAIYMRRDGPKSVRHLRDQKGKEYLEKTYAYDMSRTSRYRRKLKED